MGSGSEAEAGFPRGLGPLLLAGAFVALAAWSWEKWADVQIDFGNELYIGWRLSEGDALYRDIAHRHGPLAHYANASWFRVFGVSVRTLVLCNLAVLAAILTLVWQIFRDACGRLTATAVGLVLLAVFGFSQYVAIGNFNYVAPYHHHQTYGLLLSLGALAALGRALRGHAVRWCALAGFCLGGVFLTKAELFVPAALGVGVGLVWVASAAGAAAPRALSACALSALGLPLLALLGLSLQMPAGLAFEGVLGNWSHLDSLAADAFYRRGAGFDDVRGGLASLLLAFAAVAAFAAASLGVDRLLARRLEAGWWLAGALAGAMLLAFLALRAEPPWFRLARGLPLATGLTAVGLGGYCLGHRRTPGVLVRWGALAAYAVFATALLGKMLLRARFEQYGFALAMPATLLLVATLTNLLPGWLAPGTGRVARALGLAVVAAGALFFLGATHEHQRRRDFAIGQGADRIVAESPYTSSRPRLLAQVLERLEALAEPGDTLLVLPEGSGLNYWLRLENPTRFTLFLPTELRAFGEPAVLAELRAHPPDFVVLVHRGSEEFGVGPFGRDPENGLALMEWVDAGYRRVVRLGAEPFVSDRFGVVLLERESDAALR